MSPTTAMSPTMIHAEELDYSALLSEMRSRFARVANEPLFTTNVEDLFEIYLSAFPEEQKQHHNCNTCKGFLRKYGGLVTIDGNGCAQSATWTSDVSGMYREPVERILAEIRKAKVTGVFLSGAQELGTAVTGKWTHFSLELPKNRVFTSNTASPSQKTAERHEDYVNVSRALGEFGIDLVRRAVAILRSDALYRGEKVLGPAEWFLLLHERISGKCSACRSNLIWKAVATAPEGFCHPRSSMFGTLLEDLANGITGERAAANFAAKMHPLIYQRPQTPPSVGNIREAERLVEKLGIARSLKRRFARIEDLELLWKPRPVTAVETEGVFGHLLPSKKREVDDVPATTMTWEKFARTILPELASLDILTEFGPMPFVAFTAAEDPEAPPILQWDNEGHRNDVAWYFYSGGTLPQRFSLRTNEWYRVTGITLKPCQWERNTSKLSHHGDFAAFIIDGAKDVSNNSLSLFPEFLRSELHQVRSTIEAHSQAERLSGYNEQSACGLAIQPTRHNLLTVRATTSDRIRRTILLDRWD